MIYLPSILPFDKYLLNISSKSLNPLSITALASDITCSEVLEEDILLNLIIPLANELSIVSPSDFNLLSTIGIEVSTNSAASSSSISEY